HAGAAAEKPQDDALLQSAELRLAITLEEFGDGHAGGGLDFVVAVDEGHTEFGGDAAADGGLAGAHQADEDDGPVAQPLQQTGMSADRPSAHGARGSLLAPAIDIKSAGASRRPPGEAGHAVKIRASP